MIETMLSYNLERGMELPFKFDGSAIHFFFFISGWQPHQNEGWGMIIE